MMNDPSQKNSRVPGVKNVRDIVAFNVESNNRNHRTFVQTPFNGTRSFQEKTLNGTRNGKTLSAKPLLDCLQPEPLLTSKPFEKSVSQRRRKNRPFDQENLGRQNDDQVNKPEISTGKTEIGRSTVDIREPTSEHLFALQNAFNSILTERSLSPTSLQQRQLVFSKLYQLITQAKPDCQVNLYGSMYFECALEKPGIMDIDVQFKETLQYDTLKELLDIINKSDLCKEARIETECKPSSISLITREPNMRVKLTSGYTRGIYLSKLLRIYTKMDSRVIKLLRLFRILSKICNTDKPELGTLHPVVFHIMIIHFLQQIDQPILPCLHEYAYGVDHVPITLNENQYPEFFAVCEKYSREWKSKNTTPVELIFLQFLSYYVKTFNTKQFVVSIQTRMPVMKLDKNWHSRKLLVEDPTDMKRSLCQTMQSVRSIDYFRDTFNAALNYFGRKQKKIPKILSSDCSMKSSADDDLIEIVPDDENEIPTVEPTHSLHNSYKLFYKRLPAAVARDMNIKQGRVREYYKQTFDQRTNPLSQGILPATSSTNKFDDLDENDIQEALQHDLENNFEIMDENDDDQNENHVHLLQTLSSNEDNEEQDVNDQFQQIQIEQQEAAFSIDDEELVEKTTPIVMNDIQLVEEITPESKSSEEGITADTIQPSPEDIKPAETSNNDLPSSTETEVHSPTASPSSPIKIKAKSPVTTDGNAPMPSPFTLPIQLEQILGSAPAPKDKESSEFFYDFQAENFHAEQGAPYVCTTCNGVGHLKDECPELIVPKMIDLPATTEQWHNIISLLCRDITKRCKPTVRDTENRQQILSQLEKQCQKDYPECSLHAFGSFYNGFGFRQSDLDVCMVFKDQREQNNEEILRIMQKILRAMKISNAFENVQPVLHAKVPIIRSRHRQLHIEIDISLHNMLAIENTRLLKTYTDIDPRVSELGYMSKHLAKLCGIGDASRGTLSSYAYIILLIHFLQQTKPAVLPVLQKLSDDPTKKNSMYKKCSKWNVYFYDDLINMNKLWKKENQSSTGALWLEFLRFYTEQFNYDEHVVSIRQIEPLLKHEKGWFRQTIAIEDPFELSHNLAGGLSLRNWTIIRRVFIRARQQFGVQLQDVDFSKPNMSTIESTLFDIDQLCPTNAPKRCEWCKGPYHIRKRCPKLATLSHEEDKKQRARNANEQYYQTDNNHHRSNDGYYYSNNAMNGYYQHQQQQQYQRQPQHPKSAPTDQRPFRYTNEEGPRDHHRTHDQQTTYSRRMYPPNNHPRACFQCGELGHMKVNCPSSRKNNSNPRSNISS